jgi:hypothetical protein
MNPVELEHLTQGFDRWSSTWKSTERYLALALEDARKRNDNPKLSADETAAIRGEIAFIKKAMRLPDIIEKAANPRPKMTRREPGEEY